MHLSPRRWLRWGLMSNTSRLAIAPAISSIFGRAAMLRAITASCGRTCWKMTPLTGPEDTEA